MADPAPKDHTRSPGLSERYIAAAEGRLAHSRARLSSIIDQCEEIGLLSNISAGGIRSVLRRTANDDPFDLRWLDAWGRLGDMVVTREKCAHISDMRRHQCPDISVARTQQPRESENPSSIRRRNRFAKSNRFCSN